MEYSNHYNNSKGNDASYEPSPPCPRMQRLHAGLHRHMGFPICPGQCPRHALPVRKQAGYGGRSMNDFCAYGNIFFLLLVSSVTDIRNRLTS